MSIKERYSFAKISTLNLFALYTQVKGDSETDVCLEFLVRIFNQSLCSDAEERAVKNSLETLLVSKFILWCDWYDLTMYWCVAKLLTGHWVQVYRYNGSSIGAFVLTVDWDESGDWFLTLKSSESVLIWKFSCKNTLMTNKNKDWLFEILWVIALFHLQIRNNVL